ncbi:hypothetical protein JVT61DRAFT_9802 [Boletus reticuloceps]|uniref:Peptidase C14 caspase domain-containing protein n=1 Tax=Boletus reticuloceps TaxID=495285 RepID=A0A8I3A645_9AGAM|nr:hypothetical protein JVT61DRAFT_9802 [Boletus reticuloceps]
MSSAEPSDNNSQKPFVSGCTTCKSWYTFSTTSLQKRLQRAWLVESDVHSSRFNSSCRFALVIGIDNYAHCGKLGGAVRDAKAIKQYLEEALGVSEDHIYTLFDEEATRHAIINAFRKLQNDGRIDRGDPIMIFYSGHGGEISPPRSWGIERKIQCLLPQDCETAGANPPTDCAPIPDRTIGALIEDIARAKGDNIASAKPSLPSSSIAVIRPRVLEDKTTNISLAVLTFTLTFQKPSMTTSGEVDRGKLLMVSHIMVSDRTSS